MQPDGGLWKYWVPVLTSDGWLRMGLISHFYIFKHFCNYVCTNFAHFLMHKTYILNFITNDKPLLILILIFNITL